MPGCHLVQLSALSAQQIRSDLVLLILDLKTSTDGESISSGDNLFLYYSTLLAKNCSLMSSSNMPSHSLLYCGFSVGVIQCTGTKYNVQCHRTLLAIPSHISEWELKSTQAVSWKLLAPQGLFPWFSSMYLIWIMQRPSVHISKQPSQSTTFPCQCKSRLHFGQSAGLGSGFVLKWLKSLTAVFFHSYFHE